MDNFDIKRWRNQHFHANNLITEAQFTDYSNNELEGYVRELSKQRADAASKGQSTLVDSLNKEIEAANRELKKRSQGLKDLTRTDVNELDINDPVMVKAAKLDEAVEGTCDCGCGGCDGKNKEMSLAEVLDSDADIEDYIKDFQKSDAPQFKGKSKKDRREMAIAAFLQKNNMKKEELAEIVREVLSTYKVTAGNERQVEDELRKKGVKNPDVKPGQEITAENQDMDFEKQNALNELEDILSQLVNLGDEAKSIIRSYFPEHMSRAEAYRVFDLGMSSNRHNTTLATIVDEISQEMNGGEMYEGTLNEAHFTAVANLGAKKVKEHLDNWHEVQDFLFKMEQRNAVSVELTKTGEDGRSQTNVYDWTGDDWERVSKGELTEGSMEEDDQSWVDQAMKDYEDMRSERGAEDYGEEEAASRKASEEEAAEYEDHILKMIADFEEKEANRYATPMRDDEELGITTRE